MTRLKIEEELFNNKGPREFPGAFDSQLLAGSKWSR